LKKIIFHIATILFLASLVSCESIIEYELPQNDPKMVLNSYFTNDSIWEVTIYESKNILENDDFKFVPGALVEVADQNGVVYPLTYIGLGKYASLNNDKPVIGSTYTISAKHPSFDDVSATSSMPTKVEIANIDTSSISQFGYEELESKITFTDPKNENNYYSLSLVYSYVSVYQFDSFPADTINASWQLYYYSNESQFTDTWIYTSDGIVFSDEFFDGREYTLSIISEKPYIYDNPFEMILSASIQYELESISEDVYLYKKSLEAQNLTSFDPFAQPVQVYNNISGGFGIFGGTSKSVETLILR
jgi:hypothetical protein